MPRALSLLLVLFFSVGLAETPQTAEGKKHSENMAKGVDLFKKQVRQMLIEKCVDCHGGRPKIKGKFDLNTRETLLKGGAEGTSVVAGDASASRFVKLIRHEQEPHMPHKKKKLSDGEIALLAEWVNLGAPYDKPLVEKTKIQESLTALSDEDRNFWSFKPLKRVAPPKVQNEKWCRTPIDHFIAARLEQKRLRPNPIDSKQKLLRRAYFDLIGLPPPPEEVEAFLNDKSSDAYQKLLDRLLSSEHYGERWARHWLDVARFAESHGFEHDYDRPFAFHYRDFVIKAFNQDLPYDQFVKWQLAGDEFEPDNSLAMMATGFVGAGVFPTQITKNEVERTRYDALDDMLSTTGTAMLGLTIGCARCHDHKYDPITTHEYYRMVSTFTTTVRSNIDLDLTPDGYKKQKEIYDKAHEPLVAALKKYEKEQLSSKLEAWLLEREESEAPQSVWTTLDLVEKKSHGGATFTRLDDGSYLVSGKSPRNDKWTLVAHTGLQGITSIRLEPLAHKSMKRGGPGRAGNGNFALSIFRVTAKPLNGKGKPIQVKLVNPRASFNQGNHLHVKLTIDDNRVSAWAVDPQFGKDHAAAWDVAGDITFEGGTILVFDMEFNNNVHHSIGRPRLSISTAPQPVPLKEKGAPQGLVEVFAILEKGTGDLNEKQMAMLANYYKTLDPDWRKLNRKIQAHLAKAPKRKKEKVMVVSEGFKPIRHHTQGADFFKETYFLNRGDTDQKQGAASQGFLRALMRGDKDETHWQEAPPKGGRTSYRRRSMANWITDVDYGAGLLLARVIVNRLWHHHVGRGIVSTPNDFGFQGEPPTHPELLDWLATELIAGGWRLKPLHKLIMNSAVYMQTVKLDPARFKSDPGNQLYGRRERMRLEAEVIRDSVLAASGTLDTRMFGKGTLSESQTRRSIYFTVKRSKLIPMMTLFDAPEPLVSQGSRDSTTIAPQALMLMNNPNIRTYARNLAKRLVPFADKSIGEAVKQGYLITVGRKPDRAERKNSIAFVNEQMSLYKADNKPNERNLALADFSQVLLSLNEFVYVE